MYDLAFRDRRFVKPPDFTDTTERCDQAQDDRGERHWDLEEHQDLQQEDNSSRWECNRRDLEVGFGKLF